MLPGITFLESEVTAVTVWRRSDVDVRTVSRGAIPFMSSEKVIIVTTRLFRIQGQNALFNTSQRLPGEWILSNNAAAAANSHLHFELLDLLQPFAKAQPFNERH